MIPALLTDTVTTDLDRALYFTLLWGLEAVELRTVGGPSDRVPFVNEEKLRRRLAEHDLPVVAIVPGMFEGSARDRRGWLNEIAAFDEVLAFCQRIQCPRVVVSAFVAEPEQVEDIAAEALRRAGDKAAHYGITLTVLNEVEGAFSVGQALADLLAEVDHPAVKAAWDPGAALKAGEDPRAGLAALAPYVELVRCTDWRWSPEQQRWEPAPLGEGAVDWPEHLRQLHRLRYTGPLSLVVQGTPPPKRGFRDASRLVELIRQVQRALTAAR
jgi:sugar phosphate isomerase/epimerase